jgi:hypothetical protein
MFADDTELDAAEKHDDSELLEINLNSDLTKMKDYFDYNKLSLNVPKCEFMLIGTHQSLTKMPQLNVHINNEPLKQLNVVKYLGIYIHSNHKWDQHIRKLIPNISAKIGILRSLRKIVPINTLKQLFNAIVQPHFDYADNVFVTTTVTNKTKLQLLQTRAARLITGSGPRTSRNTMFSELGWLSLQHRRDLHKCVMIYKCLNNLAPSYLCELFSANNTIHSHHTRQSSQLRTIKTHTENY